MMMNTIEGRNMVKPITDSTQFSRIDADNTRQQEATPIALTPETDSVSLSSTSKQMAALRDMINDISEVNHARIEFIRQVINAGEYVINPRAIAQSMMTEVA